MVAEHREDFSVGSIVDDIEVAATRFALSPALRLVAPPELAEESSVRWSKTIASFCSNATGSTASTSPLGATSKSDLNDGSNQRVVDGRRILEVSYRDFWRSCEAVASKLRASLAASSSADNERVQPVALVCVTWCGPLLSVAQLAVLRAECVLVHADPGDPRFVDILHDCKPDFLIVETSSAPPQKILQELGRTKRPFTLFGIADVLEDPSTLFNAADAKPSSPNVARTSQEILKDRSCCCGDVLGNTTPSTVGSSPAALLSSESKDPTKVTSGLVGAAASSKDENGAPTTNGAMLHTRGKRSTAEDDNSNLRTRIYTIQVAVPANRKVACYGVVRSATTVSEKTKFMQSTNRVRFCYYQVALLIRTWVIPLPLGQPEGVSSWRRRTSLRVSCRRWLHPPRGQQTNQA
ncbi:unnamed protein product [Amoebophrya sp. A25]|nr:unnamed protein product [Amoebophrya sp. A25]|eukprot:GSA25T00005029001.1